MVRPVPGIWSLVLGTRDAWGGAPYQLRSGRSSASWEMRARSGSAVDRGICVDHWLCGIAGCMAGPQADSVLDVFVCVLSGREKITVRSEPEKTPDDARALKSALEDTV